MTTQTPLTAFQAALEARINELGKEFIAATAVISDETARKTVFDVFTVGYTQAIQDFQDGKWDDLLNEGRIGDVRVKA